jgi:hypothetical protein
MVESYHVQTFAANFSKRHYAAEQQLKQARFAPPLHRLVEMRPSGQKAGMISQADAYRQ